MYKLISDSRGIGHSVSMKPLTLSEIEKAKYIFKNGQCLPYAVAVCKKEGYKNVLVLREIDDDKIIHVFALKNNNISAVDIDGEHTLVSLFYKNFDEDISGNDVEEFIKLTVDEAVDKYASQLVNLDWDFAEKFIS